MKRKTIIIIFAFTIVLIILGVGVLMINVPLKDIKNTNMIEVELQQGDRLYEINDRVVIRKIIRAISKPEKESFDWKSSTHLPSMALYFYTEETMYGPIYCYDELGIGQFKEETQGKYIELPDKLFDWVYDAIEQ